MTGAKNNDMADVGRMNRWMETVSGSVFLGDCNLKSVKESNDGDKITIVLKKKKKKKEKKESETTKEERISL
jgi:Tfp pilus assembly protein PilN